MAKSFRNSAAALGSRGGRAGVGASKRRGDSDFYRRLVGLRRDRRVEKTGMEHRHLNHQDFTLAAIDDIISNGRWDSWVRLRLVLRRREEVRKKVLGICDSQVNDPSAQRHRIWRRYAQAAEAES